MTMKAFFAGIVGGLGRIEGALFGGLLLGVLEALVIGYVSGLYVDAIAFAVLGMLLIWRPTGLLGRKPLARV
jgi:branched-chain amino acid transport system permease protein